MSAIKIECPHMNTIKFSCPQCNQELEGDQSNIGQNVVCPTCQHQFAVVIEPQHELAVEAVPQPVAQKTVMPPLTRKERALLIITTTSGEISGRAIASYLGIARGLVVRSATGGQAFFGGLEKMFGGNNASYAAVCEQARTDAFRLMIDHAAQLGADAIIAFRYDATEFAQGVTEVLAYGTAVRLSEK